MSIVFDLNQWRSAESSHCSPNLKPIERCFSRRLAEGGKLLAVAQRFDDVHAADTVLAIEISQGTGDAQHAVIAARRQHQLVGSLLQDPQAGIVGRGDRIEDLAVGLGIRRQMRHTQPRETGALAVTRLCHPCRDLGAAFRGRGPHQIGGAHRAELDLDIETVDQRARQAPLIVARTAPPLAQTWPGSPAMPHLQTRVAFLPYGPSLLKTLKSAPYEREPKTLGQHLKKRRMELGLRQRDEQARFSLDKETYANWEKGRCYPAMRNWPAIIAFLQFDPHGEPRSIGEALKAYR